jgi:hypothetical protein
MPAGRARGLPIDMPAVTQGRPLMRFAFGGSSREPELAAVESGPGPTGGAETSNRHSCFPDAPREAKSAAQSKANASDINDHASTVSRMQRPKGLFALFVLDHGPDDLRRRRFIFNNYHQPGLRRRAITASRSLHIAELFRNPDRLNGSVPIYVL